MHRRQRPTVTSTDGLDTYDLIPKIELHRHVDGTVRPSKVIELAAVS
jgi:hypothetical protein